VSVDLHLQKELRAADRVFSLDITLASDSQRIVLYGPSGSGKSLTLKAIAGLMRPDSGHIRIQGRTLFDSAQGIDVRVQERNVAYLFQDYALFPHLTVAQNVVGDGANIIGGDKVAAIEPGIGAATAVQRNGRPRDDCAVL